MARSRKILPIAAIVCGLIATAAWIAVLGFGLLRAVQLVINSQVLMSPNVVPDDRMFWFGLAVGIAVGAPLGFLLYALIEAGRSEDG